MGWLFIVGCHFLGPRQIEALAGRARGVWLRSFMHLLAPRIWVKESGVREHQLQHLFSFRQSSRKDEDGPSSHDVLETSRSPDHTLDPSGPQRASSRVPFPCRLNGKVHQAIEGKLWVEMNGDKASTQMQSYAVYYPGVTEGRAGPQPHPQLPAPGGQLFRVERKAVLFYGHLFGNNFFVAAQ